MDSWISLCLLNKPTAYFNVNKAGQSQGIVTLIRPMGNTTAFEINQLTNSWGTASRRAYMFPGKMTTTFTVRIKKNSSGTYDYLVNGTKVDLTEDGGSDFTSAFTTLMEKGSVYFYMGVSSKDSAQQIEWRISKINGTAVKATPQPPLPQLPILRPFPSPLRPFPQRAKPQPETHQPEQPAINPLYRPAVSPMQVRQTAQYQQQISTTLLKPPKRPATPKQNPFSPRKKALQKEPTAEPDKVFGLGNSY